MGFEEIAGGIKELGNVGTGCESQEQNKSFLGQCQEGSRGQMFPQLSQLPVSTRSGTRRGIKGHLLYFSCH